MCESNTKVTEPVKTKNDQETIRAKIEETVALSLAGEYGFSMKEEQRVRHFLQSHLHPSSRVSRAKVLD